ncbi:MAG: hypothetical protein J5529_08370 [Prevotella sp.]|nr:hypothetical protein [Prevotella sp.]
MKKSLLTILLLTLSFLAVEAQSVKERFAFEGTLDGKTAVRLAFEVNSSNIAAGHIYYPKAKHPARIMIIGYKHSNGTYHLDEYQADGEITGNLSLIIKGGKLTGQWTNPRTEKDMSFTNMRTISFPKGFGGLLTPDSPDKLGHEYAYKRYHTGMRELMGGHVSLKAAGKNRVHFDICNVPSNIAEGKSAPGRPAVLQGNTFTYTKVNECGYGFKAIFFPRFVVLETTTSYETLGCFGAHTAFDGIYIKTKD